MLIFTKSEVRRRVLVALLLVALWGIQKFRMFSNNWPFFGDFGTWGRYALDMLLGMVSFAQFKIILYRGLLALKPKIQAPAKKFVPGYRDFVPKFKKWRKN